MSSSSNPDPTPAPPPLQEHIEATPKSLDQTLTDLRIRVAVLENELRNANGLNTTHLATIAQLNLEISRLQAERPVSVGQIQVLQTHLAYAEQEKVDAQNGSVALAKTYGELMMSSEKKHSDVVTEMSELKGKLQALERDNAELRARVNGGAFFSGPGVAMAPVVGPENANPFHPGAVVDRILAEYPPGDADVGVANGRSVLPSGRRIVAMDWPEDEAVPEMAPETDGDATEEAGSAGSSPGLQPSNGPSPVHKTNADYGMKTLDDVLNDGDDSDNVSDQLAAVETQMASLQTVIPPTVLQTGFDGRGVRGENYSNRRGRNQGFNRNTHQPIHGDATLLIGPNGIWGSAEERDDEIDAHVSCAARDTPFPGYFKHGVQYTPVNTDENVSRAVLFSGLPDDFKLKDILARVRGGQIVTSSFINGKAIVVFVKQEDAKVYVDFTDTYPIILEYASEQIKPSITLIPTPTYPLSSGMQYKLKGDRSRHIVIPQLPADFSIGRFELDLDNQNGLRLASLIDMYIDEHETLHLEFNSIDNAVFAYGILHRWPGYRNLKVLFAEDMSARSLEDLHLPLVPHDPIPDCRFDIPDGIPAHLLSQPKARETEEVGEGNGDGVVSQRAHLAALQTRQAAALEGLQSSRWADDVEDPKEGNGGDVVPESALQAALRAPRERQVVKASEGLQSSRWADDAEDPKEVNGDGVVPESALHAALRNPHARQVVKASEGLQSSRWADDDEEFQQKVSKALVGGGSRVNPAPLNSPASTTQRESIDDVVTSPSSSASPVEAVASPEKHQGPDMYKLACGDWVEWSPRIIDQKDALKAILAAAAAAGHTTRPVMSVDETVSLSTPSPNAHLIAMMHADNDTAIPSTGPPVDVSGKGKGVTINEESVTIPQKAYVESVTDEEPNVKVESETDEEADIKEEDLGDEKFNPDEIDLEDSSEGGEADDEIDDGEEYRDLEDEDDE